jgi:hypothetical protein
MATSYEVQVDNPHEFLRQRTQRFHDTHVVEPTVSLGVNPETQEVERTPVPTSLQELITSANEQVDEDEEPEAELERHLDQPVRDVLPELITNNRHLDRSEIVGLLSGLENALDGTEDRAVIVATAQLLIDSRQLQERNWHYSVGRELAALSYVTDKTPEYVDASTFDNDFITLADNWDDWATEHADERIRNEVSIPGDLNYHYEFDYESYASDLRQEYDVVDILDNSDVLIFSA